MQTIPTALAGFDHDKVIKWAAQATDSSWMKYAGGDAYFAVWMALVNRRVVRRIGIGVLDLGDATYRDWYDDGIDPQEAANLAIDEDDTFGGHGFGSDWE